MADSTIRVAPSATGSAYMRIAGVATVDDPGSAYVVLCGVETDGSITPLKCDSSGRLIVVISDEVEA